MEPEQVAGEIGEGTYADRCDYCEHWHPLSNSRVMGWCTARSPVPAMPPMLILLARQPEDHLSAYNQGCAQFAVRSALKENDRGE